MTDDEETGEHQKEGDGEEQSKEGDLRNGEEHGDEEATLRRNEGPRENMEDSNGVDTGREDVEGLRHAEEWLREQEEPNENELSE